MKCIINISNRMKNQKIKTLNYKNKMRNIKRKFKKLNYNYKINKFKHISKETDWWIN